MPITEDRSRTLGRKFRIIVSAIMTVVTEGRSETQEEVIRLRLLWETSRYEAVEALGLSRQVRGLRHWQ